jgi:hypothetical protein
MTRAARQDFHRDVRAMMRPFPADEPFRFNRLQSMSTSGQNVIPLVERLGVLRRPRQASDIVDEGGEEAIRLYDGLVTPLVPKLGAPLFDASKKTPHRIFVVPTSGGGVYLLTPEHAPLIVRDLGDEIAFAVDYVGDESALRAVVVLGLASDRVAGIAVNTSEGPVSLSIDDNVFFQRFSAIASMSSLKGLLVELDDGSRRVVRFSG